MRVFLLAEKEGFEYWAGDFRPFFGMSLYVLPSLFAQRMMFGCTSLSQIESAAKGKF